MAAIVNISLMTVMERTREIGSLMALGYRRKHILTLFLVESVVIGGLGGVLGLMTGILGIGILNFSGLSVKLPGQVIATTLYPTVPVT
jgi:ABC-type antimicrobial peptide transport system permease subunit